MATMNIAVRFLTELAGFVAVGYIGLRLPVPMPLPAIAGIGAAAALIALWAVVVAPTARNGLTQAQKDVIGTAILLVVAGALAVAGQPTLAGVFAAIVVLNAALLFVFPDPRESYRSVAR
jgi:Protein of unknown function (DUF2568)